MRVRMKTQIGGYRDGEPWPAIGGTLEVPGHEADGLIHNGYAEAAPAHEEASDAGPEQDATGTADESPEAGADSDPAAPAEPDDPATGAAEADAGDDAPAALTKTRKTKA